jgi:hypothetical protein
MAKVEVGSQLKWQGRSVVCTSIHTHQETCYARVDSIVMRHDMNNSCNVKIITQEWDDFGEDEIISIEYQKIELTEPGKNLYFLFSYYKVKKEQLDGPTAVEGSDRKALTSTP